MNRIFMKDQSANDDFFHCLQPVNDVPEIQWATAMLIAHVETDQGPDLRVLRAELNDGSAHRVGAGVEDSGAESMVYVDGDELILSLGTTSLESGDASLVIGFDLLSAVRVTASNFDRDPAPAIVLRNYAAGQIHVLNGEEESVVLEQGTWAIQAAAVPDGVTRSGILRFTKTTGGQQERRRSA